MIKEEIKDIVSILKNKDRAHLARVIEENWNKTCLEYSKELNSWKPDKPVEPELLDAFTEELKRLEFDKASQEKIISSVEKRRILQTAPHLVITEGPKMFCINWLGSLSVSEKEFYIVGAFSGNPFSNITHPGRIQTKNGEINLIPSKMQNALVYRSKIPQQLLEKVQELPERLKNLLPRALPESSFTKWALESCQKIEKQALGKENIVYLDINEVVALYLVKVLQNSPHIFHKIFFHNETRKKFIKAFPDEIMFYAPVVNGKYKEMENFILSEKNLKSKHREIPLENPEILINEIKNGKLCPALVLVFTALSFLNRFKCLGSFAQVEYLPHYQKKLALLPFMKTFDIETVPTSSLTVGIFPNDINIFPVDLAIENKKLKQDGNMLFGELVINIKDRLISSYLKVKK